MKKLLTLAVVLCLWHVANAQYSLIKQDVNPQMGSGAARFTSFKDKTYFIANDGTHGYELWWSDGHSYGMVADINPGPGDAFDAGTYSSHNLCASGGMLYFPARDTAPRVQLWAYDGTNAPARVTNISAPYEVAGQVTAVGSSVYFIVSNTVLGPQNVIYSFSTQTHAYQAITATPPCSTIIPMASFRGKLVFSGASSNGCELQEYDPANGSLKLVDINPAGSSIPSGYYQYNGTLFFIAQKMGGGYEIFSYDGVQHKQLTSDIAGPGNGSVAAASLMGGEMSVYNNKLYFFAYYSGFYRNNLFAYDPVADTVTQAAVLNTPYAANGMAVYGGKLYISADSNNGQNSGLFMYNGSNLSHFSSLGFNTYTMPEWLTESNGRLYYSDWDFNSLVTSFEAYVFTDSLALGVKQITGAHGVTVYPNPATSEVHFSFSLDVAANLRVQIADMQGRTVFTATKQHSTGKSEVVVPVKELPTGLYIYTVANAEGLVLGRGRLVKE